MTISTMVSPTASATVKNAAPAMDLASDAQISATTGFSGLLAQEMAARHNALENAGAEAAEGGKGASEAGTTSAVKPSLPLDSSVGRRGCRNPGKRSGDKGWRQLHGSRNRSRACKFLGHPPSK